MVDIAMIVIILFGALVVRSVIDALSDKPLLPRQRR